MTRSLRPAPLAVRPLAAAIGPWASMPHRQQVSLNIEPDRVERVLQVCGGTCRAKAVEQGLRFLHQNDRLDQTVVLPVFAGQHRRAWRHGFATRFLF